MAKPDKKSHKDWFDRRAAKALADQISAAHSPFDSKRFVSLCCKGLDALEFNARVRQFSNALHSTLPDNYPKTAKILSRSMPEVLPNCESVTDGWLQWPIGQFIADYGLEHFHESMACMVELTQRFSAEYAVRPFVKHRSEETFDFLYAQLSDKSPHVRRWCSEGCRTRLPWGEKLVGLITDPSPIMPILESLKDDPELYVRKSVANNLNDLSKDHPVMVMDLCHSWSKSAKSERDWIIRQGLRTLIKAGDKRALKLVGFSKPNGVTAELSLSAKRISIGESININATLHNSSRRSQQLLIDYLVHYQGKNKSDRRKVFKWKTIELKAKDELVIEKSHPMKRTTVRELYQGKHKVELQLNGEIVAGRFFELTD